jgi:hypothetical protein
MADMSGRSIGLEQVHGLAQQLLSIIDEGRGLGLGEVPHEVLAALERRVGPSLADPERRLQRVRAAVRFTSRRPHLGRGAKAEAAQWHLALLQVDALAGAEGEAAEILAIAGEAWRRCASAVLAHPIEIVAEQLLRAPPAPGLARPWRRRLRVLPGRIEAMTAALGDIHSRLAGPLALPPAHDQEGCAAWEGALRELVRPAGRLVRLFRGHALLVRAEELRMWRRLIAVTQHGLLDDELSDRERAQLRADAGPILRLDQEARRRRRRPLDPQGLGAACLHHSY